MVPNQKTVACYVRVSTESQIENYSIDEQIQRLKAYCSARDWTIVQIYTDGGYSGGNIDRPALKKMLTDIKTGAISAIVVYKLDRLSRSQKDTLMLIEDEFLPNGVDFVSINENFDTSTPFGRAMIGILSVFAQLEKDQITERFTMGRIGRSKAGYYHGGPTPPTGYNYIEGELVVDEYKAQQVREAYDMLLSGLSVNAIQKRLHEKYGGWKSASVTLNILRNSTYTGRVKYAGIEYEGNHEPIISEETYNAVRSLLDSQQRYDRKNSAQKSPFRSDYLLTGMIFCGRCGARYSANHGFYKCYSRAKSSPKFIIDPSCKNDNWKIGDLDEYIISKISALASSPGDIDKIALSRQERKPLDKSKIEKQIANLEKQMTRLIDLYQLGSIPMDSLAERIKEIDAEKESLQRFILEDTQSTDDRKVSFSDALKKFREGFSDAPLEKKRLYLSNIIHSITIDGKSVKVKFTI